VEEDPLDDFRAVRLPPRCEEEDRLVRLFLLDDFLDFDLVAIMPPVRRA
jgi:hypothetical protein